MEEKNEAKQPQEPTGTPAKKPALNNDLRTFVIALVAAAVVVTGYHLTRMVMRSRRTGPKFVSCQCKHKRGSRKAQPPQKTVEKKTVEKKKTPATPTQVARRLLKASMNFDLAAMIKMCAGEKKAELEKDAAVMKELEEKAAKGDETARKQLAERKKFFDALKEQQKGLKVEFVNEKIEGDLATLEMITSKDGKVLDKSPVYFRKINGRWKMISKKDYKAAKPAK